MSFEPQPTLAWQFENSNVDSIQNLGPTFSTVTSGTTIAPSYVAGKYGQAVYLDNTNTRSVLASNSNIVYTLTQTYSLNNFSIAAWVNPVSINTSFTNTFFNAGSGVAFRTQFQITTNGANSVATTFSNGLSFPLTSTGSLPVGQWTHHCLTFALTPSTTNLFATYYINGFAQSSTTVIQTLDPIDISQLVIGSTGQATGASANASIDDLRVYRQALTAAQVLALYVKQGAPTDTSTAPKLAWQFESSNVESIQGLVPIAQVSPGPAQLHGLATLVSQAPTVGGEAVYFPGTTGSYMAASSSAVANLAGNSNIFVECWVYQVNAGTPFGQGIISSAQTSQQWILRISGGTPSIYIGGGPVAGGSFTSGTIPLNTWTHLAFSWTIGPTSNTAYCFTNGIAAGSFTMTSLFASNPGTSPIIGGYNYTEIMNGYIRDLRVVRGGIVPTASFPLVQYPDPFAYTLPSYVSGSGTVVFTLLSQFVTYPAGKFNKCLRLNNGTSGLNSSIEYSSLTSTLNNFSIAAWVYPYSVNTARTNTFFEMKPLAATGTQFQVSAATTGKSTVAVTTNGGSLTELNSVANLTLGKWTHHCLTFSNVGATIVGNVFASYYINGTLQASSNATTQASSLLSNIVMGSTTTASADSGLDDVRAYDRTLTSAEVSSVYLSFGDPAGPKTYAAGVSSNVTTDGDGFTTHTFTDPGTFTCLRPGVADVLVVAGGGGGGSGTPGASDAGGGGGGGGVQYFPNYNIRSGTYTVTVGTGGPGGNGPAATRGTNGNPSQFMEIVSLGGGGGGTQNASGLFGGSGGGGGRAPNGTIAGGAGVYGQGNSGGVGVTGPLGGAAGGAGAGSSGTGPLGGAGISYPAISTATYGAGGEAMPDNTSLAGIPVGGPATGNGGGGNGNNPSNWQAGAGGPGIVMIKYLTQGAPQGYETVYTGETTIGSFAGYNSPTANVQVFNGLTSPGTAPYTWVKPTSGTFARVECVAGGGGGNNTTNSTVSCIVKLFMNDLGTLANNNVLSTAQMTAIGISYTGSVTTSNVTNISIPEKSLNINTTGSSLICTVTPQPAGTVLNTTTGSSGTISGVYVRGNGGAGGGYSYATLPIADLPATVAVSVAGGGGAAGNGTASVFGPVTSPSFTGSVTASNGVTPSTPTNGGSLGIGFAGAAPSNIVSGGGGIGYSIVTSPTLVLSGYGGGGGGNGLVAGGASLFAGKGGDGAPATGGVSANQDGEYPGGGGGGGLSPITIVGGRGAPGRVRIIVY